MVDPAVGDGLGHGWQPVDGYGEVHPHGRKEFWGSPADFKARASLHDLSPPPPA